MRKHHTLGSFLVALILLVAFSLNPIDALAKSYSWGFTKSKNGQPVDVGHELESVLKKYDAIYKGKPDKKVIYLTFDNGFENGYTESILDTLKKEKVPAAFFLTGHYVKSATDLVKRMVNEGHIIGNHSYGHPNMANLSEEKMVEEWQKFDEVLKQLTGVERTYYARPPEGVFSEKVLEVGNKHGYRHIFWSIAFVDWDRNSTKGGDYAYNELMKQLHPGAIILMHTVAKHNAEGLPRFIEEAKKQGYTFESLDNLVLDNALETKKQ
ncbi:delta-lactam-biosynthetic de-N-acetylase [Ureibacillus sp. MALMAid1270]|uniref:delta-lactam-biosynthetic de-N-acetylase n=1 Tax=Ureibacillus sp. MALMAid1270 TaxID=3411629 RepID=UPI003BA5D28B